MAWSTWLIPGFIFHMPSLTLQFPLQWRWFVSEGLSFPWAVLRDPVQHPVEPGGKEESWEIRRRVARKGALAKRRLPDCLNSHWTKKLGGPMYPSNLQIAWNMPKPSFEMSWIYSFLFHPHLTSFLMDFFHILETYSGYCNGLTLDRLLSYKDWVQEHLA